MIPMVCIGVGLASPAIRFLPTGTETNSMLHFVATTSKGKTLSVRAGALVWGKGAPVETAGSMLKSCRSTGNAMESLCAAHSGIGLFLDELKTADAKAAATFAYDFATGHGKLRMHGQKWTTSVMYSWSLFALSSGEITLAERAKDHAFRRQIADAGGEARVINFHLDDEIFTNLHDHESPAAIAVALGNAAATHYGCAGPAFVQWLLGHPDEARARLTALIAVWNDVSAEVLGVHLQSSQAERVAQRLAPIVAGAVLGASVIGIPWSDGNDKIDNAGGALIGPAGRVMMGAFTNLLTLWIGRISPKASTQVIEAFSQLRAYYQGSPASFPITRIGSSQVMEGQPGPDESDLAGHHDPTTRRGFRVMSGGKVEPDKFGAERLKDGELKICRLHSDRSEAIHELDRGYAPGGLPRATRQVASGNQ
jgi:hypothetical protein